MIEYYINKYYILYDNGTDSDERAIIISLDDGLWYIIDANN